MTLLRLGLSSVWCNGLASMMYQSAVSMDCACRTLASSSSRGRKQWPSVTPVRSGVLSVIPLLEVEGGGWGGAGSTARHSVLGDGLLSHSRLSWFLLGLFSCLRLGFGCFDAPSIRPSCSGEKGLRGQIASAVPCGPGPNTCMECAGWWCGVGPRSVSLEQSGGGDFGSAYW